MSDDNNLGQASILAVNQYLQLAKAQNLPIEQLLQDLGLTQELLNDNAQQISGCKFQQLIATLIKLSDDELFGLHTAQYVQPGSYSVLGYITMNCETLGEAITKIQPFEKLVGDMGKTFFKPVENQQGKYFSIGWSCLFSDKLVRRHAIDNCLASWLTFARYLTNDNSKPVQVLLSRTEPNLEQCAQYRKIFNCSVLFNQATDQIIFDQALLALPLNKGNKELLSTLESYAKEQIANISQEQDLITRTLALIKQNLTSGNITQEDIARLLNLSAKTLQRKLKAENTHFKSLVDEVRLTTSNDLLKNSSLNLNQISEQLGFGEPRSFFRWFQKITQLTPGQYRQQFML